MRVIELVKRQTALSAAITPAVLIAGLVIIDTNIAWSGGYSILLGIIRVPQVGLLLAAGSVITLLIRAVALGYQRKFGALCMFVVCVAVLFAYCEHDGRKRVLKGQRDALNAVTTMLKNPDKANIRYLKPELKQELREILDKSSLEANYERSSRQFFIYWYRLKGRSGKALEIEVIMLKDETQFRVDRPDTSMAGKQPSV